MVRKLLVVGVIATIGLGGVQAQQGTEQEMLRRIAVQPRDLAAQLELVKIYVASNRFAEAEQILTRALAQVREQRVIAQQMPVAPPPPPAPVVTGDMVRVGSGIKEPKLLRRVNPVYPPIAQSARVTGIVIIETILDYDGTVQDAKVLRSVPLLDQAALDAVRQWSFTPTLVNGVPVRVVMTVTVNFSLN